MKHHPSNHGFDHFLGFNASNDDWPAAFWRDKTEIVKDIQLDQAKYTALFTDDAIDFMKGSGDQPFFVYLAHKDPHQPCMPSEDFAGSSNAGRHGDAVQEVDWNLGRIMRYLKESGKDRNTLVVFTSDNGPWADGSPGGPRGRKGESFEGGFRVPFVAWWPGRIPGGTVVRAASMNIDLEGVRSGDLKYFRSVNPKTWPIPLDKKSTFFGAALAAQVVKFESEFFGNLRGLGD